MIFLPRMTRKICLALCLIILTPSAIFADHKDVLAGFFGVIPFVCTSIAATYAAYCGWQWLNKKAPQATPVQPQVAPQQASPAQPQLPLQSQPAAQPKRTPPFFLRFVLNAHKKKSLILRPLRATLNKKLFLAAATPLNEFSDYHEKCEPIQLLLDKGADINTTDKDGKTPLVHVIAAEPGTAYMPSLILTIRYMVEAKADVKTSGPLWFSIWKTSFTDEQRSRLIQELCTLGADINQPLEKYHSFVHCLAAHNQPSTLLCVLNQKPDLTLFMENGLNPLHIATLHKQTEQIVSLLNAQADIDAPSLSGETPLMLAAKDPYTTNILDLLLQNNAALDLQNKYDGKTALHYAVQESNFSGVEQLLRAGASCDITSKDGITPLRQIFNNPTDTHATERMLNVFLANGSSENEVHTAAQDAIQEQQLLVEASKFYPTRKFTSTIGFIEHVYDNVFHKKADNTAYSPAADLDVT